MKPVEQTIVCPQKGNCLPACLASILELDIDKVPCYLDEEWWKEYQKFLKPLGYQIKFHSADYKRKKGPDDYSILVVNSSEMGCSHAMVAFNGEVVWDPSPWRDLRDPDEEKLYWILVKPYHRKRQAHDTGTEGPASSTVS